MFVKQVIKRTGQVVEFDPKRITIAINEAITATPDHGISIPDFDEILTKEILEELDYQYYDAEEVPTIENIQDVVEQKLVESGNFIVAKGYILYRMERAQKRADNRILELEKLDKNLLKVKKHNGKTEKFSKEKLNKIWKLAAGTKLKQCPFDKVFEVFKITLIDSIDTSQIIINLRKACIDMISVKNVDWQLVAGRLYTMELYKQAIRNRKISMKEVYSSKSWKTHFDDYIKKGLYYEDFYKYYSDKDVQEAGKWIDTKRDFTYGYSTALAFARRYLLNPNKIIHELPQEMYLAVALFLAIPEDKSKRMKVAKEIYEATSTQKLSLPTPTLLNARTNFHQLSSCFKLNLDDDLRSIYHNIENMAQISKFGGGIGAYLGHIRSRGASIRGIKDTSGGVIPWIRVINDTACAVNQLGARAGAISPTLDIWHRDIHDFLNLQTETGDIRAKAFDVFPSISVPDIFMRRVENDEMWTLFDPHEIRSVTGKRLEDHFGVEFDALYEKLEKDKRITLTEEVSAKELMKIFLKTAVETGMPYVFFRDLVNDVNPNKHVGNVYSTQLCTEICQNTSEAKFESETLSDGKVALTYEPGDTVVCNLASINVAKVHTDAEIKKIIPIAMRVLDNVITLNFYPVKESEITAKKYRSVGLGFMGLAEYLACNGMSFEKADSREHVDVLFEKFGYETLNSSMNLAKERGAYELFEGSEWSKGLLFGRDKKWYKKNSKTNKDWDKLITDIKKTGLRFAYHLSPAPNTSTASVVGTTAGVLPIYKKFFVETNAMAPTVNVAPNLNQSNFWLYKEYQNMDMNDVIDMISVIYKWVDQSISFEWMLDPSRISPADLYGYYMKAWKMKIKTVYYLRSMSGDVNSEACVSCSG